MGAVQQVRLEVLEYRGLTRWRWRLTGPTGAFLADHAVDLDESDAEYEGFEDLYAYVQAFADVDDSLASEAQLVARVGRWIGEGVLGPVGEALVDLAPVVARVAVPTGAEALLYRPLELGHVRGQPLATQDVSLVFEPAASAQATEQKRPVGRRLRLLGLFSLPVDENALALRHERYALSRLVERVAAVRSRAVELRVMQYGVTRAQLRQVLEEEPGWDVVHFSGHGLPGGLVLERDDGTTDRVSSKDLVGLLRAGRRQVKLVLLSSCFSATAAAEETLRLLGIDVPSRREARSRDRGAWMRRSRATRDAVGSAHDSTAANAADLPKGRLRDGVRNVGADERVAAQDDQVALPALATDLAAQLGSAVLAMRYPVDDGFAVLLAQEFYTQLLDHGQPVPRALQLALPKATAPPMAGSPPMSVATPALFGPLAAELQLTPPAGPALMFNEVAAGKLADFPAQPERFVGRTGSMTRASQALAPESGRAGVLVHGMSGAGKTTCAVELAYTHESTFQQLVWYQAPAAGAGTTAIAAALPGLAAHLEAQLPGLRLTHRVDDQDALARFLPTLTEFFERQARVLIVLDNLESLLTDDGDWRDHRWRLLVEALTGHQGLSRVILTSRRHPVQPADLHKRVAVEPIHALSRDEAVLLARQLPRLGALIAGSTGIDPTQGRRLVARTLKVVQGHPKLLELADGDAADPTTLERRLREADRAWASGEQPLAAFFTTGTAQVSAEEYLRVLQDWTRGAAADLPAASRDLLWFLCSLEDDDRLEDIVTANWAGLWQLLQRPGPAPDLQTVLRPLAEHALLEVDAPSGRRTTGSPASGADTQRALRMHPVIADTERAQAGDDFRAAVDEHLAAYWTDQAHQAQRQESSHATGQEMVHAARRAVPYLLRLRKWAEAGELLELALMRDLALTTRLALLPALYQIAQATRGSNQEQASAGRLASALRLVDPSRAEPILRNLLARAERRQNFASAAVAASNLAGLLSDLNRLPEALQLIERSQRYGIRAGSGPWGQLHTEVKRQQILVFLGHNQQALDEFPALQHRMNTLSLEAAKREGITPWSVYESMLYNARLAADNLNQWSNALSFNAELIASEERRGAPPVVIARSRYNDYGPLLRLGRAEEARNLVQICLSTFKAEQDLALIGLAYSALADIESARRHLPDATDMSRRALRYLYRTNDVRTISTIHYNLADYLRRSQQDPTIGVSVLAHRLAAAVLDLLTHDGHLKESLHVVAHELADFGNKAAPSSFQQLRERVEEIDGVRFGSLVEHLLPPSTTAEDALASVLRRARGLPMRDRLAWPIRVTSRQPLSDPWA